MRFLRSVRIFSLLQDTRTQGFAEILQLLCKQYWYLAVLQLTDLISCGVLSQAPQTLQDKEHPKQESTQYAYPLKRTS